MNKLISSQGRIKNYYSLGLALLSIFIFSIFFVKTAEAAKSILIGSSSDYVGLGLTQSGVRFKVAPEANMEGVRILSSNYSPFVIRDSADTYDIFRIDQSGNITGALGGNSTAWGKSGNNLYPSDVADNVGVGLSSPVSKLHILGTATIDPRGITNSFSQGLRIGNATDSYSTINFGTSVLASTGNQANQWWIGKDGRDNGFNIWGASPTDVLHIVPSGNIGIGTISPASKFNIYEAAGVAHGAAQGGLILDHGNSGGASSIVFRSTANRGSDYGFIQYQDASTVGGAGESARLILGTSNDADDHMALMPAGSVGIGTLTPGYKLDVQGTGSFTQPVIVGTPTLANHAVTKSYVDSATSINAWLIGGNQNADIANNTNSSAYTAAAVELRELNHGGSLTGALSEAPRLSFHWSGRVASQIALNTDGTVMVRDNPGTGYEKFAAGNITANGTITSTGSIIAAGGSSSNWASINAGGSQSINAAGSIYSYNSLCVGNASGACSSTGGVVIGLTNATAAINIPSSGSTIFNNGGNVGIGTTNPGYRLDINTGASSLYPLNLVSSNKFVRIGALNGTYAHVDTDATEGFYFYDAVLSGAGNNKLNTASGNTYLASSGGNVGIGTISPSTKLDVTGGVRIVHSAAPSLLIENNASSITAFQLISQGSTRSTISTNGDAYFSGNVSSTNGTGLTTRFNVSSLDVNAIGDQPALFGGSTGSWTNRGPSGHNGGAILHMPTHPGGYYSDLWFDTANGKVYSRAVNAGTIGGWKNIITDDGAGNVTIAGNMTAASFQYSDRTLKKNIATIESPLYKILKLRGVTFDWKKDNTASVGLIAQEVEQVFPELVRENEGVKTVQYSNLVAPLIEAVKEQQKEIENLNSRIQALESDK